MKYDTKEFETLHFIINELHKLEEVEYVIGTNTSDDPEDADYKKVECNIVWIDDKRNVQLIEAYSNDFNEALQLAWKQYKEASNGSADKAATGA